MLVKLETLKCLIYRIFEARYMSLDQLARNSPFFELICGSYDL